VMKKRPLIYVCVKLFFSTYTTVSFNCHVLMVENFNWRRNAFDTYVGYVPS
jgi:hypothetical protein